MEHKKWAQRRSRKKERSDVIGKWAFALLAALFFLAIPGCGEKYEAPPAGIAETGIHETQTQIQPEPEGKEVQYTSMLIHPKESDFVRVLDYIPDICVDLKYARTDNFTGQRIYAFEDVYLRYGTVMKLKAVHEELAGQGLQLKIWDGFRPVSAQFALWEICPDDTYVADPNKGFSNHSRGFAVDVTLLDAAGREMEMPSDFDDFSARADRDYSDCTPEAAKNARLLETAMEKHGFSGYIGEWWHFNDTQRYDVETCFDPSVVCRRDVRQDTPLLEAVGEADSAILVIPAGETVTVLGYDAEFSLVEYWGYRGYIPTATASE